MSVSSLARTASALLLAASLSGMPGVLASAFEDDCCAERCDGSLDGKTCPPGCAQSACGKAPRSVGAVAAVAFRTPGPSSSCSVGSVTVPDLPVVDGGLFRPPIA